jgi:tRNA-dihydrouridine synthase
MRLGWDDTSRNAPELAQRAEAAGVKAITVHGRTRNQFYKGNADWRAVADVKAAVTVPVIVNGDIVDCQTAREALRQSKADAVMIGRGAYGKPWIAAAMDDALEAGETMRAPDAPRRLEIALEHFRDCLAFYGDHHGVKIFRKHLAWYVEQAPMLSPEAKRAARSALCRLSAPCDVEHGLNEVWQAA